MSSDEEDPSNQWLCQKMCQGGEAVGLMVDGCKGGRDSLLSYAHEREAENRAAWVAESSKKQCHRAP